MKRAAGSAGARFVAPLRLAVECLVRLEPLTKPGQMGKLFISEL